MPVRSIKTPEQSKQFSKVSGKLSMRKKRVQKQKSKNETVYLKWNKYFDLSEPVSIVRVPKTQNLTHFTFLPLSSVVHFSFFYILLYGSEFQQHFYYPRRSFQFCQNIQSLNYGRGRGKGKGLRVRDARRQQTVFSPDAALPSIFTSTGQSQNTKSILVSYRTAIWDY